MVFESGIESKKEFHSGKKSVSSRTVSTLVMFALASCILRIESVNNSCRVDAQTR